MMKEVIVNERRLFADLLFNIETCLDLLSNDQCEAGNRTSESGDAVIEDALRKRIDVWVEEAESEAYRSEISSIIEDLEKQYCCHEDNTSTPSVLKDVYAQCYVKEGLSDEHVLKLLEWIRVNKAERQHLKALHNLISAARKVLLSVE